MTCVVVNPTRKRPWPRLAHRHQLHWAAHQADQCRWTIHPDQHLIPLRFIGKSFGDESMLVGGIAIR